MSLSDHWTIRRRKDLNDYGDRQDFEMVKDDRRWEREKKQFLAAFPPSPAQRRPETLRVWLEADLALSGYTLEETLGTIKRGRVAYKDRPLRDALAYGVVVLRDKGATLEIIGEAIGRGPQTVANLEVRGRELLQPPAEPEACQRHLKFEPDCPACLRSAPGRAPQYSGPEQLRGRLVGGYQADD
jgi:hypothetical protein